ncbi:restriction endonuclease (plasmid) [Haladaptatus sp. SPP-AMP-3]|uniref:restriction endonuclease n=1 Tax=Haladaptatus sp. SPP-AMP-3 TaxID=3121295 RepID=UPI003C2CF843
MIRHIPESEFPEFVAALWGKQGWQTTVTEKSGKSFVALQRDGAEGLIWTKPGKGDAVSREELQQFVGICKKFGVNEGAVVTPGTFSEDAEKLGSQAAVQLVDGEKLRTIVEARELHNLVERFADGGDDESDSDEGGFSLPISIPESVPLPDEVPRKAVAVVFVAILAIVAATVVAPMILGTGGTVQTNGGWNVTANSTAPSNATGALDVRWNAKRVSKLNPESGDDGVYKPGDGKKFLLVSMNVTNTGSDSLGLRPQAFALRSNGTLHGHQPLKNTTGFQPSVLDGGESTSVWLVFSIDADAPNATIVTTGRLRRGHVRTEFTRDETLSVEA